MIEVLCTLTGIIAGIAVVVSLLNVRGERARTQARDETEDAIRMQGIAEQLQLISSHVAANVNAHSETVASINGQLGDPNNAAPEHLMSSITEILSANKAMQDRLADAQQRITKQSQLIEQASKQARTDVLTGLSNRRALDEYLTKTLRTSDSSDVLGLLMLDIDHFKNFNDTHGHITGDAVLAGFARSIAASCADDSFPARYGGEEFAVIVRGKNEAEVIRKAAKIRHFVSGQVINYEEMQLNVTASAGLCMLLPDDELSAAYERADEGLYQSKKAGRNCGHWLGPDGASPFPDMEENAIKPKPIHAQVEEFQPTEDPDGSSAPNKPSDGMQSSPKNNAGAKLRKSQSEVLELKPFLERLDLSISQLRRAELPATAIMVEAINLSGDGPSDTAAGWESFVDVIEHSFRGIDIVCLFRPHTLCIFIPGCSEDAAVERATRIQASFQAARPKWSQGACPEKLAISISQIGEDETATPFLNRLEKALDEAVDADDGEVVVHTGESSHFLQV